MALPKGEYGEPSPEGSIHRQDQLTRLRGSTGHELPLLWPERPHTDPVHQAQGQTEQSEPTQVETQLDKGQASQLLRREEFPRPAPLKDWRLQTLQSQCLVPLEVDGRKVNGYCDTGVEVMLARPEVVAPDWAMPNTYLTLTGWVGPHSKCPWQGYI